MGLYETCINSLSKNWWYHHMYEWTLMWKIEFYYKLLFSSMFFDEKANQGVSAEKQKQLRHMSVSYHVYASKIHRKRM